MRRSSLSKKMFAATVPLLLAVAASTAITVRVDLAEAARAENAAALGRVWVPLISVLDALGRESADARQIIATLPNSGTVEAMPSRTEVDDALEPLTIAVRGIDGAAAAKRSLVDARSSLLAARRDLGQLVIDPSVGAGPDTLGSDLGIDPLADYERAGRALLAIGELLPAEAGDPELGAELLAVLGLARAKVAADDVLVEFGSWRADPSDVAALFAARSAFTDLENSITEFEALAPEAWLERYRSSGFETELAAFRTDLDRIVATVDLPADQSGAESADATGFDTIAFGEFVQRGVEFQTGISDSVVEHAEAAAAATRSDGLRRTAVTLGAVVAAGLMAVLISRSITRRTRALAASADRVATQQLPALVAALDDPRGIALLPEFEPLPVRGTDELALLASSFNSMQTTLVEVADEQAEVLRRGVSDLFVTMARRNRSLIDRQLALLDQFEAEVDDQDLLARYYQLDHLATRMRRNSESLLVLADAEPKHMRTASTEIDDVVRASISEIEDYRRIEVEALEALRVRGDVIADVSHLLAELLDNATAFSAPDTTVRIGGRRAGDSYLLRIVDDGIGITSDRLDRLNDLLRHPPVVGLSVDSTLGLSVVSLLAAKHGIEVALEPRRPGLSVDIVLPASAFDSAGAAIAPKVDRGEVDEFRSEVEADPTPSVETVDDPGSTTAERLAISLNLAAFTSGMNRARSNDTQDDTQDGTQDGTQAGITQAGIESASEDRPVVAEHTDVLAAHTEAEESSQHRSISELPRPAVGSIPVMVGVHPGLPPAPGGRPADPSMSPTRGEFDRPLAPPVTTTAPHRQPVAPADAIAPRLPDPRPTLPTRSPGADLPDVGPDRLADIDGATPSALEAALTAGIRSRGRSLSGDLRSESPGHDRTDLEGAPK